MSNTYSEAGMFRALWNRLLGKSHGGKRDRYEVFGWPKQLTVDHFLAMYHRNGIASRIVRAFPQATWSEAPDVYDESRTSDEEPGGFAKEWERLEKDLKIRHYLERADRLAGVGQFGVLFLGFADNAEPYQPVEGRAELQYLSAFGEQSVQVTRWDMDPRSPRFGLPELYTLQTGGARAGGQASASKSITVHHSRTLHLAEFLDDDEVYGLPRLLAGYNDLMDLEKVVGSSAETFWLAANRGILWSADAGAEFDDEDLDRMKDQADEYEHQLRRNITGTGLKATVLGSDTPNPEANARTLLQKLAGTYGIPLRILTGSEAGELASSQDATNWATQVDNRRQNYAAPQVLRPLIEKLIETGNLPQPQGSFTVGWDPVASLSEREQAEIAKIRTESLTAYSNSTGADMLVPPREYRAEFLGLPEETGYQEDELPEDEEDEDVQAGFGSNQPPQGDADV